ncbi:MAG: T9SS type A sorting domain-containing protein [Calditrichaeota bacterium]|nr:T9SS type A sorting domain-containing protein [Calditrichota bacterium]
MLKNTFSLTAGGKLIRHLWKSAAATLTFLIFAANAIYAAPSKVYLDRTPDGSSLTAKLSQPPETFASVILDGERALNLCAGMDELGGQPGAPALPVYSRWVEIPAGKQARLEITTKGETIQEDVLVAPFMDPDNPAAISLNSELYAQDRLFPAEPAVLSAPLTIGGKRYALLDLSAYRYNPARRELCIAEELTAEIIFEPDPNSLIPHPSSLIPPEPWREVARVLSEDSPSRDEIVRRVDYLGHFVILIPNNQQALQAIRPLVDWKKRKGYLVTVATTADIGNTAASITAWLRDAWRNWRVPPTYVLIIGDSQGDLTLPIHLDGLPPMQGWYASDQPYVQFEGLGDANPETWIPEAFIGRFPASNVGELTVMVTKLLAYERTPFRQTPWVEGAVLIGQGVRSCIQTNVAVRELMQNYGYDRQRLFEAYNDYPEPIDLGVIDRGVDGGVGFVNFRGYNNWGNYTQDMIRQRTNTGKLPVVFGMVCSTNDFTGRYVQPECHGEAWLKAFRNNNPTGGIACFGPTDLYTHTWFNNVQDGALVHYLLNYDVHSLGPLTILAKLSLLRNFPSLRQLGNGYSVGYYFYTYNILGDPSLQIWTRDPRPLEVSLPENLPAGTTLLNFTVTDADEEPVSNAYLHIYYNDNTRFGGYSDANGEVSLSIPPLIEGAYLVTVTGANLVPFERQFQVGQADRYLSLSNLELLDEEGFDVHGNGDGNLNPGETVGLSISLTNAGRDNLLNVMANLSSDNPLVDIIISDIDYGQINSGVETGAVPFIVRLSPTAEDGSVIEFDLTVSAGQTAFPTAFDLPVVGYKLQAARVRFENDQTLLPGTQQRMILTVANAGWLNASPLQGVLYCSDRSIQIRSAEAPFGQIVIGASADNARRPFEVAASPLAYIGTVVKFGLALRDSLGRLDSLEFGVPLGPTTTISPQGPDAYGYWVFDSRDTTTGMAPRFERLSGVVNLNLSDANDEGNDRGDHGQRAIVDLPFEFVYYGRGYRRITVSTNGWLSFGASDQVAWHNQELGSPLAPPALVAPFWDDLHSGAVFTRNDRDNGRFIVEWRNFNLSTMQSRFSFAVALYDPTFRFTRTGDGEIEFHYSDIPIQRLPRDPDYAEVPVTIGLCSPDRKSILQIAHGGAFHPATTPIQSQLAVRFTTGELTEFGGVQGRVLDAANNAPLPNVRVMLDGTGFFALTDAQGNYQIFNALVGMYNVTAAKLHYNHTTAADVQVIEDEIAEVNFSLTHPEFGCDAESIEMVVPPQMVDSAAFNIWNTGNGPLDFNFRLNYEARRDEPWDVIFDYNATAACSGSTWLQGVAFDGEFFYLSARNSFSEMPHWIYVLNHQGELERRFPQFTVDSLASRGYYALDWCEGNLLAVERNNILEITTEGDILDTIPSLQRPTQSVVWAPERGSLFAKSITANDFLELDRDGHLVATYRSPEMMRTYGLAWHPADPDGYPLYIFRDNDQVLQDFGTRMQICKMNPQTGDFRFVHNFVLANGDKVQDCAITKKWDPLKWIFIGLINRPDGDRLVGIELGPNLTWISYQPQRGSIPAGETQPIRLRFSPEGMPERNYFVILELYHNAVGDQHNIPIYFTVGWDDIDDAIKNNRLPTEFAIEAVYPNPFNPAATLIFNLPQTAAVEFSLWDAQGRMARWMDLGWLPAGRHVVNVDAGGVSELANGIYFARVAAGGRTAVRKVALIK